MDTNNTERNKGEVRTSIRLEPEVYTAIATLAEEEDRPSQANMIERLLKTHPRVKKVLEAETAGVNA